MRSLYWRIFLSIGVTMAVIVAASILIAFRAFEQWSDAMEDFQPGRIVEDARQALQADSEAGLRDWLEKTLEDYPGLTIWIVDGEGDDLLGRDLPNRLARNFWMSRPPPPGRPGRIGPLHELSGPDGRRYRMVIGPKRPGAFGILGVPGARWAILLSALLIVAVASFLLARSFSNPVKGLREVSHRLASGQLDARTGHGVSSRRDEIGALARDFDHMAERLQRLIGGRQELFRNVSHELRTPLTRMQVAVELARRKSSGDEAELDRIAAEISKLDGLIGQILDLTRLDDPGKKLQQTPLDLGEVVGEIVDAADIEARAAGVTIDWRRSGPCRVVGDRLLLISAIENVLRNAIRFSPEGETISVRVEPAADGGTVTVVVSDRGPGVPESEIEHIFDPFHQVDRARDPDRPGKGVGLAIAAGVVRRHGGDIVASNASPSGLTVRMRIPAA